MLQITYLPCSLHALQQWPHPMHCTGIESEVSNFTCQRIWDGSTYFSFRFTWTVPPHWARTYVADNFGIFTSTEPASTRPYGTIPFSLRVRKVQHAVYARNYDIPTSYAEWSTWLHRNHCWTRRLFPTLGCWEYSVSFRGKPSENHCQSWHFMRVFFPAKFWFYEH